MKKLSVIVCLFMFALMPLLAQVKQTVAVLGDSYSTFEGFIPKGYATWYTTAVQKATDVNKVEQTWWWQVIKEGGYKMGNINSYSGSTISTPATAMRITATVHSSTALPCWAIRTSS